MADTTTTTRRPTKLEVEAYDYFRELLEDGETPTNGPVGELFAKLRPIVEDGGRPVLSTRPATELEAETCAVLAERLDAGHFLCGPAARLFADLCELIPADEAPGADDLERVARDYLGFETLRRRPYAEELDRREVGAAAVREALARAYELGREAGRKEAYVEGLEIGRASAEAERAKMVDLLRELVRAGDANTRAARELAKERLAAGFLADVRAVVAKADGR